VERKRKGKKLHHIHSKVNTNDGRFRGVCFLRKGEEDLEKRGICLPGQMILRKLSNRSRQGLELKGGGGEGTFGGGCSFGLLRDRC